MRYDLRRFWFKSPRGRAVAVYVREGTNDWNTANASLSEDEYGLRDLRLSGLALDIGGYLGTVSLGLLIDNPDLRVVCVEPVPENADLIARNATANGVGDRLTIVQRPAGRGGEEITVRYAYQGGENELHHAFVGNMSVTAPATEHKAITHRAVGLGFLLGRTEASFMKTDAEGAEFALLDSPDVARIVRIHGEWHNSPLPDGRQGSQAIIRELLEPTHDVTFSGPEGGPGGFIAIRR